MSNTHWIIGCIASFLLGIGAANLYEHASSDRKTDSERWIKLSKPSSSEGVLTYSSEALFNSDIKLPDIESLTGKAKFVKNTTNNPTEIKLGYVVDLEIAPLDAAALPEKYKPAEGDSAKAEKAAPEVVVYEVVFYFILKDKDGFPLMKAASNKQAVRSGIINHIQLFASSFIPPAVAANTEAIDVRMEAVKCVSCRSDRAPRKRGLF